MIFIIMGKSASGKDTILKKLMAQSESLFLEEIVPYTTRPIRSGEENGKDYYFSSIEEMRQLQDRNLIVESRVYHTVHGDWHYFTVDNEALRAGNRKFILISTLEAYQKFIDYYGKDMIVPIYLEVDDHLRLERAIRREKEQSNPSYKEVCRRFLADEEDFSEERLREMRIKNRYDASDPEFCLQEITNLIRNY